MGLVDGTRELMRHDLTVWPPGTEAVAHRADSTRLPQAGVTRRGFLAVAGLTAATLVIGGVGLRQAPWRDWLGAAEDRLGVDIPGAAGISHEYTLHSRYVDEPVGYSIAWPPGSEPGDPLSVCFALPGRGGGPPMGFAGYVAAAMRSGESRPYAVVGVDGGVSYWHRRKSGEDRLSMLLRELVPLCARRFKLGGGGRKRAVIGWSMGGYGALLAAETEPRLFAAVVAVSPAVWTSYDAMMLGPRDAFDSAADFAKHDVIAHADRLAGVNLRLDCGKQDPFYGYVTYLDAALPEPPSGGYSKGGHDQDYWSKVAPAEAEFIGRALS
jgi:enterochelin esterase-like enzyme